MDAIVVCRVLGAVSLAGALLAFSPAFAETTAFKATLDGQSEVPPNTTKGTGSVEASYDSASKILTWTITFAGLTGAATAAHFHGPAAPGANAPPVVPLKGDLKSPIKGEATLTDAQASELTGGQIYFNIHTAANKGGEIRGQLTKK